MTLDVEADTVSPLPRSAPLPSENGEFSTADNGTSEYRGTAGLRVEDQVVARPAIKPEPRLKRPLDLALASAMLLVSSPAWAAIALAIKLEDGGPVFYHQERWGRAGHLFRVKKFRTMIADSDRKFGVRQASVGDARITRVGRLLRAMGLDELPQILNIWRGEMSFVGPRALATGERDRDGNPLAYDQLPGFAERLSVRPGLTSFATIYLPKDASSDRKFAADLVYVQSQSFAIDLRLIALSIWISFRGKWETRGSKV